MLHHVGWLNQDSEDEVPRVLYVRLEIVDVVFEDYTLKFEIPIRNDGLECVHPFRHGYFEYLC